MSARWIDEGKDHPLNTERVMRELASADALDLDLSAPRKSERSERRGIGSEGVRVADSQTTLPLKAALDLRCNR
jgi:hypothetical protein